MNLGSEYLIYLTAYRLGIIAAGITSIVLGYKLFVRNVVGPQVTESQNSIEAKISNFGVTLKNAAPGTGFGLFGVIVITVMLIQGSPQYTFETLSKAGESSTKGAQDQEPGRITMRGERTDIEALINKGRSLEKAGDQSNAIVAYESALAQFALPMNQLAGLYAKRRKVDEALQLARLAAEIAPTDPDILDTLAETLAQHGDQAEAVIWMDKAASLDPRYRDKALSFKNHQGRK